jgi:uncharacterized protein (DUF1778 family)
MNAMPPQSSTAVLSVRMSAQERALLEAAAEQAHTTISDFVRRKAIEAAEMDLMERRVIEIPVEDWEKIEAWVNEPGRDIPELRRLATMRPTWET